MFGSCSAANVGRGTFSSCDDEEAVGEGEGEGANVADEADDKLVICTEDDEEEDDDEDEEEDEDVDDGDDRDDDDDAADCTEPSAPGDGGPDDRDPGSMMIRTPIGGEQRARKGSENNVKQLTKGEKDSPAIMPILP